MPDRSVYCKSGQHSCEQQSGFNLPRFSSDFAHFVSVERAEDPKPFAPRLRLPQQVASAGSSASLRLSSSHETFDIDPTC